jgi:putative membrane protein
MMGWYDNGWGWGAGIGMFVMVLFWGGLIALGVWAVARLTRGESRPMPLESPRQILDRRFASGEIDAEQYAQSRHILEGRSTATPTSHT